MAPTTACVPSIYLITHRSLLGEKMFEDLQRVRRWLTYFDEFFRTVYLDGGVAISKDIIDLVNTRSFHSVDIVGHHRLPISVLICCLCCKTTDYALILNIDNYFF